ncbi:hypothetical protein WJX84_012381 [Apatococcus fuscideae]|uniref:Uncharacterized protein n=1 Tax=Apatococcus fuscideae TaxID=2026836 RepID=A0AAW1SWP0_9CHLO
MHDSTFLAPSCRPWQPSAHPSRSHHGVDAFGSGPSAGAVPTQMDVTFAFQRKHSGNSAVGVCDHIKNWQQRLMVVCQGWPTLRQPGQGRLQRVSDVHCDPRSTSTGCDGSQAAIDE